MRKNGFTLIELLAVIVILAIIALIATPIILGIINDARKASQERSAELYLNGVELAIARRNLTEAFNPSICTIKSGVVTCEGYEEPLKVDVDGEVPESGTILLEENKVTIGTVIVFNTFNVTINTEGKIVLGSKEEQPTPPVAKGCTYVDSEDDEGKDIGKIDLSDIVTCGTESFYVMKNENNEITMLSMYNLYVGNKANYFEGDYDVTLLENPTGIQNELAKGKTSSNSKENYGTVAFSTSDYWIDEDYNLLPPYIPAEGFKAYIYDENNDVIYPYINSYKNYLKENGVSTAEARLMSYEELNEICLNVSCSAAPEWIKSTSYWIGSIPSDVNIFVMSPFGLDFASACENYFAGIRPVITISISDIQQ